MAFIQTENLFSISGVDLGNYVFQVNPAEGDFFPPKQYSRLDIIDGADVYQFPTNQKHIMRTMHWPYVEYETIYDTLRQYAAEDADGNIAVSYLTMPGLFVSGVPIKVIDVRLTALTATDPQRYEMDLDYILV